MPRSGFRTVIFDLDGTLVDSLADIARTVNDVLVRSGVPPIAPEKWPSLLGEGAYIRVRTAYGLNGVVLSDDELALRVQQFQAGYAKRMLDETKPYAGAVEALRALREDGVAIGVCTNKDEAAARAVLSGLGLLKYVSAVAGPDTYGFQKPDPRHLLGLLDSMGADPARAVLVGDTIHDIEAAHAAGIPVVHVRWGYGQPRAGSPQPEYSIGAFAELLPVVTGTVLGQVST